MAQAHQRLAGKVALVTGAGRGIGRAEALAFAAQGACVVVSDIGVGEDGGRSAKGVVDEIRSAGGTAAAVTEDISTEDGARRSVDGAVAEFGGLDILVNNAGLRAANPVDELTGEQWRRVIDSHLKGTYLMTRFAVPQLRARGGGVIINTGSEAGLGMVFNSAYAAAKEGIAGFTRSIAREQGRFGIRCNMIRPRVTVDSGGGQWEREVFSQWADVIDALGRFAVGSRGGSKPGQIAVARQVADLVVWLCTDSAAAANGRSFYVCGEEIGLWSEPELVRIAVRAGGWSADSLDASGGPHLLNELSNDFLIANVTTSR